MISAHLKRCGRNYRPRTAAGAAIVAVAAAAAAATTPSRARAQHEGDAEGKREGRGQGQGPIMGIIETDLMDRIARKPYLNYHNRDVVPPAPTTTVAGAGDGAGRPTAHHRSSSDAADVNANSGESRPRGVPRRLRILVIDLPQFRRVFDAECTADLSKAFPDGIAPPKKLKRMKSKSSHRRGSAKKSDADGDNGKAATIDVVQKSLVRSLSRCGDDLGVELLEASVADLNPRDVRRRLTFVRKRSQQKGGGEDEEAATVFAEEIVTGDDDERDDEEEWYAREVDAPWNQYAWIEEMRMRVGGWTKFDGAMERGPSISRLLYGSLYRRTTSGARTSLLDWILPWRYYGNGAGDGDGVDGEDDEIAAGKGGWWFRIWRRRRGGSVMTIASNKPHAVIANGEAMQRVPGSLRELVRCCRASDVPLYVVDDPRVWGSNTHKDVASAAEAIRKTVKDRTVTTALKLKEGSTFQRGRQLGRLETNVAHELRDRRAAARRAIEDARRSLRTEDWSDLSEQELRRELVKRKVLFISAGGGDGADSSGPSDDKYECSDNFLELCAKCTSRAEPLERHEVQMKEEEPSVDVADRSSAEEEWAEPDTHI